MCVKWEKISILTAFLKKKGERRDNVFHFIKTLEKEVFIAAVLLIAIVVLTTKGVGGDGRDAMTVMAETPAAVLEDAEGDEDISVEYGQQVVGYLLTRDARRRQEVRREAYEDQIQKAAGQDGGPHKEEEGDQGAGQGDDGQAVEAAGGNGAVSISREDYQVLLKIVEAEAGVCDRKGKILVANVILNRVKSDEFPDSVTGVVYQPSQFSPVSNGSINTCKVSSDTKESVDRALKGEDYSQGALFFMNRSASRSGAVSWFDGKLTYLFRYQGHEFFK